MTLRRDQQTFPIGTAQSGDCLLFQWGEMQVAWGLLILGVDAKEHGCPGGAMREPCRIIGLTILSHVVGEED
jgi:hypothetical protein